MKAFTDGRAPFLFSPPQYLRMEQRANASGRIAWVKSENVGAWLASA